MYQRQMPPAHGAPGLSMDSTQWSSRAVSPPQAPWAAPPLAPAAPPPLPPPRPEALATAAASTGAPPVEWTTAPPAKAARRTASELGREYHLPDCLGLSAGDGELAMGFGLCGEDSGMQAAGAEEGTAALSSPLTEETTSTLQSLLGRSRLGGFSAGPASPVAAATHALKPAGTTGKAGSGRRGGETGGLPPRAPSFAVGSAGGAALHRAGSSEIHRTEESIRHRLHLAFVGSPSSPSSASFAAAATSSSCIQEEALAAVAALRPPTPTRGLDRKAAAAAAVPATAAQQLQRHRAVGGSLVANSSRAFSSGLQEPPHKAHCSWTDVARGSVQVWTLTARSKIPETATRLLLLSFLVIREPIHHVRSH